MRNIQAVYQLIQSELNLGPQDWPDYVKLIQSIFNEAPLKRLGTKPDGTFRSPLEVMNGIKPDRRINTGSKAIIKSLYNQPLPTKRSVQFHEQEALKQSLDSMHKDVLLRVKAERQANIKALNKNTNLVSHRFTVVDFAFL